MTSLSEKTYFCRPLVKLNVVKEVCLNTRSDFFSIQNDLFDWCRYSIIKGNGNFAFLYGLIFKINNRCHRCFDSSQREKANFGINSHITRVSDANTLIILCTSCLGKYQLIIAYILVWAPEVTLRLRHSNVISYNLQLTSQVIVQHLIVRFTHVKFLLCRFFFNIPHRSPIKSKTKASRLKLATISHIWKIDIVEIWHVCTLPF